jgi:hypothetical protein
MITNSELRSLDDYLTKQGVHNKHVRQCVTDSYISCNKKHWNIKAMIKAKLWYALSKSTRPIDKNAFKMTESCARDLINYYGAWRIKHDMQKRLTRVTDSQQA